MIRDWLRPGLWWLHVAAVVAVVGCVLGGLWQMGVYEGKQAPASDGDRHAVVTYTGTFAGSPFFLPGDAGRTWVVEPFRVAGSPDALLVVRGTGSRATTPATQVTRVQVVLRPSDAIVRIPRLINETTLALRDEYGLALTDTGLPLVAAPTTDSSWTVGLRNLAYAMQWWVFAGFAAVMWWRIGRDWVAGRR